MVALTGVPDELFRVAYWEPRYEYDRGVHDGRSYWLMVGRLVGRALSPDEVDRLIAADTALWTQPNQPMIDWAMRLQMAGTPTGILSNLGDEMMLGVLAKLPWLQHFTHHTWSHSLRMAKPELAIYQHAAAGLKTDPSQILFIDDREDNIEGARAAGMQTIRYLDQTAFEREIEARGLRDLWTIGRL